MIEGPPEDRVPVSPQEALVPLTKKLEEIYFLKDLELESGESTTAAVQEWISRVQPVLETLQQEQELLKRRAVEVVAKVGPEGPLGKAAVQAWLDGEEKGIAYVSQEIKSLHETTTIRFDVARTNNVRNVRVAKIYFFAGHKKAAYSQLEYAYEDASNRGDEEQLSEINDGLYAIEDAIKADEATPRIPEEGL